MVEHADVSVVIPVLDELDSLPVLLDSLERQTLLPREVLVVDGGSTDGTQALVEEYASRADLPFEVRLLRVTDSRPGRSRNVGAREARHETIACTDAGVTLDADWLRCLTRPLRETTANASDAHDVSIGAFTARGQSLFEDLVGILLIRPPEKVKLLYAGGVSIAFRRGLWERVGGYPEDVYPCEDAQFLRDVHAAGVTPARAIDAMSYWRPRKTFGQLWQQYRAYAWGDAMIGLGLHRHALRAGFYVTCIVAMTGIFHWVGAVAGALLLLAYLARPTLRAWARTRRLATVWLAPCILMTKDLSQMCGYIEGSWNRLRGGTRDFGRRRDARGAVRKTA